MNFAEKTELILITLLLLAVLVVGRLSLPVASSFSNLVLSAASLLLLQSLFRDLWYLFSQRFKQNSGSQVKQIQCMCVESTVGILGVVIGLLLFFTQLDIYVAMNITRWLLLIGGVLVAGFLIKDYVFEWNPWRVYKDKDHLNIVFSWKKKN